MKRHLQRCIFTLATAAITLLCCRPAQAQSKLLQNLDTNKDGKVSRDEIPEGASRRLFDNIVEKYKLDPKKTYTLQELQQVMGLNITSSPASSSPTGASPTSSSSSASSSRLGGPRRSSVRGNGGPPRASADGRPFRAVEELPEAYRSYDKDGDGQIGLYEWPRDRIAEFIALDTNDDGFLTVNELKK